MSIKMNPTVKALWVAALRSGQYKQGVGRLRSARNEFCCLGVLCNLHAQAHPEIAKTQTDPERYLGSCYYMPEAVAEWSGLYTHMNVEINNVRGTLAYHNDRGVPFAQIADAIEAQL